MKIPLQTADRLARKIEAELTPFCDRIAIAGSIRRRKPFVGDIDIVALPSPGREKALLSRCCQNADLLQGQSTSFSFRLKNGMQLDLFLAQHPTVELFQHRPSNWGSVLLCRTGSKEHNLWLIEVAKRRGLTWNPQYGVFNIHGKCLAAATEEIFAVLGLHFISPEHREK
jgi:DNA polymerase (family 10)